jgi:EamA domain-containing membrane protein RarD
MTHELRMWIVPLLAVVLGLLLFATSKDKWATVGGYVFVCGFFLVLWLLAGFPIR